MKLRGGDAAHPTRMPSSMSVGATLSPRPTTNCAEQIGKGLQDALQGTSSWLGAARTFAICLMLITYFAVSVPGFMILVHLAT